MRKGLASGTLWWLLKEMPQPLTELLTLELEQIDSMRRERHQPGDTRIVSLVNHLRWMAEHRAELGEMKVQLFGVLCKYLPITLEHMLTNQLPAQSDCTYFWAREMKRLEKQPTRTAFETA